MLPFECGMTFFKYHTIIIVLCCLFQVPSLTRVPLHTVAEREQVDCC